MKGGSLKGFLLIELIVVVVVLFGGLVLIIQSLVAGLKVSKLNAAYTQAMFVLENKMSEVMLEGPDPEQGACREPFDEYSCRVNVEAVELDSGEEFPELYEVEVSVAWNIGRDRRNISASVFMLDES